MPRPCQRRREQTAAQQKRKSNNNPKPAGPPPIRHKAKQKAIHNARHGRGGRGGAGVGGVARGGRPSRNQRSGLGHELEQERDFISFSEGGNNFRVLHGRGDRSGGRFDPITFDDTDDEELEGGDLMTDDGTEESSEDLDTHDMMINVQVEEPLDRHGKVFASGSARPRKAEVMFPMVQAISIYRTLYDAGFPLHQARMNRFGTDKALGLGAQTQTQTVIRNGSDSESFARYGAITFQSDTTGDVSLGLGGLDAGRDYVFDFGVHVGKPFTTVPDSYLKTIGGNPVLLDQHPGIKAAFDFHRPGMRRTEPTQAQLAAQDRVRKAMAEKAAGGPKTRSNSKTTFFDKTPTSNGRVPNAPDSRLKPPPSAPSAPSGAPSGPRSGRKKRTWEDFIFPANSAHAKKRLDQVDENYLKTLEGMAHVIRKWPGLKEALKDYNEKTGRAGRGVQ